MHAHRKYFLVAGLLAIILGIVLAIYSGLSYYSHGICYCPDNLADCHCINPIARFDVEISISSIAVGAWLVIAARLPKRKHKI